MNFFARVPLFGELVNAKKKSFISSITELFFSTLFSTLPIWFFPILFSSFIKNSPTFGESIINSVSRGELYIYASALIGPLIYLITRRYGEWTVDGDENNRIVNAKRIGRLAFEFPYGKWFFMLSIFICMIAAICFGFVRITDIRPEVLEINRGAFLLFSIVLYIFSLFCLFSVSVYRNELETVSADLSSGERAFMDEWNNRK